jgi:hypothetical protein
MIFSAATATGVCSTCAAGYYLANSRCNSCASITACLTCDAVNNCTLCSGPGNKSVDAACAVTCNHADDDA